MNIDAKRLALPVAFLSLGACTQSMLTDGGPTAEFGEPNRQTMAAQVINPDPDYDSVVPASSAARASEAVNRYEQDAIKEPPHVPSTSPNTGS